MSLPRNLFAPSFRRQRASLLFAAIVGFMVFAATLAISAEATISALGFNWNQSMQSRLTIEIPAVGDESTVPQSERVRQILSIVRTIPGVARATPIDDDDVVGLLKPLINDPEVLRSLPIPSLIDVERSPQSSVSADEIRAQLKSAIPNIQVDDHASWLSGLSALVNGIIILSGIMALLATATLAITVGLFCRAVMASESETIALLHSMGADDTDIARHFQSLTMRLSWPASALGFGCALVCAGFMLFGISHFADLGLLAITHWLGLGLLVMLAPLGAVLIATLTAHYSVSRLLRSFP